MLQKKKLLLLSVSQVGYGHTKAADAIHKTAKKDYEKLLSVEHIDLMDFLRPTTKKIIIKTYDILAKHLPEVWGFLYHTMNQRTGDAILRDIIGLLKGRESKAFYEAVQKIQPDHILCTHSLPAQLLAISPQKNIPRIPRSCLITDYGLNQSWVVEGTARYFVATREIKEELIQKKVDPRAITVSGIPIDPVFYEKKSISLLKKKCGLPNARRVILVLAGGQGFTNLSRIIERLFQLPDSATIVAITGKNTKLFSKRKKMAPPRHIRFLPVQWTNAIDDYMRMASVIITKPGGLTTSECIALGKPMVVIDPIPGQEEWNAAYITKHHLGAIAKKPNDILRLAVKPRKIQQKKRGLPAADSIIKTIINSMV